MSASIDKEDSTDPGGGAREVLASWLEAHAAGECDTATMHRNFLEVCRRNHEAPWDALALLDQYQRRGKLQPEVARVLKSDIAQMVFGTPTEASAHARETPPSQTRAWRSRETPAPPTETDADADEEEAEDDEEESEADPAHEAPASRPRTVSSHPQRAPNPPVQFPRRSASPRVVQPQTRSALPSLRGRYDLLSTLGEGGDGIVYRALDRNRQHLPEPQRYVAIKVLHSDPPLSADALIEYQRRAHQAQSLVHPHIVRVFDFDHDGDVHFLVMELLNGQSLEDLLRCGGLPPDRALKIASDIGSALAYAHEHGVILGNLTPRKVMITPAGGAKLMDVGFPPNREGGSDAQYASRYASAERVSGELLTTSDDVYSLACITYELLTGRTPYDGRSGGAARLHQLRPEPIESLPRPAWLALERALRWTRAERDLTASQFIAALTSSSGSHATPDVPPAIRAPRRDTQDKRHSHKGVWFFAILLVLAAGGVAWWWLPTPQLAEIGERIGAVREEMEESTTPEPAAETAPPAVTDTARALEGGQLIPTQPAGSATGPSAFEAITRAPQADETAPQAAASQPENAAPESPATPAQPKATGSNGIIGFPKDTFVVRESDVVVRIPVVRTRGTRGEVSFLWRIEPNSAEPGSDYAAVGPGREFMAAGQSSTVLHIPLVSDSEREGTEMFLVHLDEVSGGARLGELTRAAVIVVDDD
jgi:serine/threonine protein kinase